MDRAQLLEDLTQNLSESGLRTLCGRLGVPFRELAGYDLQHKAKKLLDSLAAAERLPELVSELVRIRPYLADKYEDQDQLSWLDQVSAGAGKATPPQITVNFSRLEEQSARGEKKNDRDSETRSNLANLYEAPTTQWNLESQLSAATPPPAGQLPPGVTIPYQISGMITDPRNFHGRIQARRQIRARLQNMGSSAIVGMPHSGKSSLLYNLCHHESFDDSWRFLFALAHLQQSGPSLPAFLNFLLKSWYEKIGEEQYPEVQTAADFVNRVRELGEEGYRPVLCLDDFDYLAHPSSMLTDGLLEAWQVLGNEGRLAFIVTCCSPLVDVLKQSGFYTGFGTIFNQIDLNLLTMDEAHRLVQKPALRQGVSIPDAVVKELINFCGAHPLYLQLGAYHLYPDLWQREGLSERMQNAFRDSAVASWRELWRQLSPLQQRLLSELIQVDPPLVVMRQYRFLAQYGILQKSGSRYQIFSRAFADWAADRSE